MKIEDIARIIEAVVFVSGDGVDKDEFKRVYDLSDKEINKCLDILKAKYNENSGVNIITYKNKIQLCSNPSLADSVAEILNPIRERSLTKAALETVAIIAYKQPITRAEIEGIRGVNCDYAMQLLQSNNLIEVVGRKDTVGKPLLFGTTETFLKRFNIENLDSLPNHKQLLERIQVLHGESDSLYREFTIPEDEDEANQDVDASVEQQKNEVEVNELSVKEKEEQPVKKSTKKKAETASKQEKVEQSTSEPQEVIQPVKDNAEQADTAKPKLSWRDKMRAKMDENAEKYENLDEYIKK